jgi:hypothetical protein
MFAGLMQLTPVTGAIYAGMEKYAAMMDIERRKMFANEVEGRGKPLSRDDLNSPAFARGAYIAVEAASRTVDDEKVRLIGRMLRNGLDQGLLDQFDEFKEMVHIVDSLHPRELAIMFILKEQFDRLGQDADQHKMEIPDDLLDIFKDKTRQVSADRVRWLRATKEIASRLRISPEMREAMVNRISRTGLILETPLFDGGRIVYASPLFHRLFELLP